MPLKWKGHGNGYTNHRTWKITTTTNSTIFCKVDGHDWYTYAKDPTQEFCSRCGEFRKKEEP